MTTPIGTTRTYLQSLAGDWAGTGTGEFPTLESFEYNETLAIRILSQETVQYEQKTWRMTHDGQVPSHHELGFIGVEGNGTITMASAQGLDRVEVMAGHLEEIPHGFQLMLASTSLAHDERMIRSWRTWILTRDHLRYDMGMATKSTPKGAHHLTANLYRVST